VANICTVKVSVAGITVGSVRFDDRKRLFFCDEGVPSVVLSDIRVSYYRNNCLFGMSGDGYVWEEVPEEKESEFLMTRWAKMRQLR
jgi:hypothetical protein